MHITSKSRYALKIMIDLAQLVPEGSHTQRHFVAERQRIPSDYMDHILSRLRESGLIESIRGRGGGFRLKKDPQDVTVWDIFTAVEDVVYPVDCIESGTSCVGIDVCSSKGAWAEISKRIESSLSGLNLKQIAEDAPNIAKLADVEAVGGVHECPPPRKSVGGTLQ